MNARESTRESNDLDPGNVIKATRFRPPTGGSELPTVRIPWRLSIVVAVLAATVWAAWFVWTARSVAIKAEPDIASVFVEEWLAPHVGNHWLLRPGKRRLRVEAPGYTTFAGTINVGEAPLQTQQVTLQALPGHLRIKVAPVAQADIFVDGTKRGSAPGTIKDIAAGTREIQIRASRYQTFVATVEMEGKGIEQNLTAVLDPAWAAVAIDSKPSGAQIIVDGENLGETPLDIELLQGRRVLQRDAIANYNEPRRGGGDRELGCHDSGRVRLDGDEQRVNLDLARHTIVELVAHELRVATGSDRVDARFENQLDAVADQALLNNGGGVRILARQHVVSYVEQRNPAAEARP